MEWIHTNQSLPKEYQPVLVQLTDNKKLGMPPSVVVGYLKHPAGVESEWYFVTPGCYQHRVDDGCFVTHWSDCLGDSFCAPLWFYGKHNEAKAKA